MGGKVLANTLAYYRITAYSTTSIVEYTVCRTDRLVSAVIYFRPPCWRSLTHLGTEDGAALEARQTRRRASQHGPTILLL